MSDKKNIDRLFQEQLKNFEATPDDAVWEHIHNRLHNNKRKRRILIPIWWKLGGIAAILTLLFTVGNVMLNKTTEINTHNSVVDSNATKNASEETPKSNIDFKDVITKKEGDSKIVNNSSKSKTLENNKTTTIANSETSTHNTKSENNTVTNSNIKTKKNTSNTSLAQQKRLTNNTNAIVKQIPNLPKLNTSSDIKNKSEINQLLQPSENQNTVSKTPTIKEEVLNEEQNIIETPETSIENAIAEASTTKEDEKEEKLNKWSISSNVAPVYFNTLGKGSSIDNQFVNNTKDGEINMSYGIAGTYALNHKLKIRAGVNKLALGYSTNDVIAFNGIDARVRQGNIKFKDNTITFMSTESLSYVSVPEIVNTNIKGALDQRFGFIEIPLELEYSVIAKKIGVNVIGGFSTLFLTQNEVFSVLEGDRRLIGEATNISNTSYSANFGLGLDYKISKKIKVNLEPTFKYQLNTFSNSSGNFKPYFIGVYTGLSYKF